MSYARVSVVLAAIVCARAYKVVSVAVGIAGAEGATVTGELGQSLTVRCRAYGSPPPTVHWYRGHDIVPNSSSQYETHGQVLLIRQLEIDKLGEYECRATNGESGGATWRVVVRAYQPQSPYLVERKVAIVPFVTTIQSNFDVPLSIKRPNCISYMDECKRLERTCAYRLKLSRSLEGCARCDCEEPANCDAKRRACDTLRCQYGVERIITPDRCETCSCLGPPCFTVCSLQHLTPEPLDTPSPPTTHAPERPNCSSYMDECTKLERMCAYKLKLSRSPNGCARCECEKPANCGAQRRACDTLQCRYGILKTATPDGCEKCACLESPCNAKKCPKGQRCVASPSPHPTTQAIRYVAKCETIGKQAGVSPGTSAGKCVPPRRVSQKCKEMLIDLQLIAQQMRRERTPLYKGCKV